MFVMPCAVVALLLLCLSFLSFGLMVGTRSRPYGLCHRSYTLAHIKGFGSSYLHVYVCLLLCFMFMLASLVLGFATLDALSKFVVVWLCLTPMRPCLDVTLGMHCHGAGCLVHTFPFFPLRVLICLPCLLVPPVGFICIFTHLLTCPCMSLTC